MEKFDKMTTKLDENELYTILLSRGFKKEGQLLVRNFSSKNKLYWTEVSISKFYINF